MNSKIKERRYTEKNLKAALESVRKNKISIREASRRFNVPRTTLQDKLAGKLPETISSRGPSTVLTSVEEIKIVEWCIALTKCGFPVDQTQLLDTVQKIVKADGRKTPFVDGRPSRTWFKLFLKRHPQIAFRAPETISKARASITEEMIRDWFAKLETYLKEFNAERILKDPRRILNGDETGFSLCPKTGKVLAPKGYKNVYQIKGGNEKDNITVLFTCTASGEVVTPCVIFPYVRPPKELINSVPSTWFFGLSESGWMKGDVFFEYVANGLNKWLLENKVEKPVIFFVDGHRSHLSLELSEFCHNNGIILYALPPNTTHILQPADVSVFKPIKTEWKKVVADWQKSFNTIENVTKLTFCSLLESTFSNMKNLPESIRNGFRKCGLFPFNPEAIDYTKCVRDNICARKEKGNESRESRIQNPEPDRYDVAIEVIKSISENLLARDIDINIILDEIRKARQCSSDMTEDATRDLTTGDTNVIDYFTNVEPGTYEYEFDDITTDNLPTDASFIHNYVPSNTERSSTDLDIPSLPTPNTLGPSSIRTLLNDLDLERPSTSSFNMIPTAPTSPKDTKKAQHSTSNVTTSPLQITSSTLVASTPTVPCSSKNISKGCSPSIHNFLTTPCGTHIFSKQRPKKTMKALSAISSFEWRNIMMKKETEKKEKTEAVQKRKEERLKKKDNKFKKQKKSKNIKKCPKCKDELHTDTENEDYTNIGCDNCTKWYHLKCTHFKNYEEAVQSVFYCEICKNKFTA